MKYQASSFLYLFFPDSPTEVTRGWILTHNSSKHALWRKEVLFGSTRWPTFWVQISQKPSKNGLLQARSSVRKRTQDEWHHRRLNNRKQRVYCLSYHPNDYSCRIAQFLHQMFNVSALLLDDAFLKCVVIEVVLFSIVSFKTLTFQNVV